MQQQTMILKKYADNKVIRSINDFIETKYFMVVLAFLSVCCNVFGLEIYVYTIVISFGIYLCLFARDMRTLVFAVPIMYVSPSMQNNPASNPNSIFFPQNGLWMIILYLSIFFVLLLLRVFLNIKKDNFFKHKRKLLLGFIFLAVAFGLGGAGQKEYTFLNLRYAALLFASLFVFYYCIIALVDWESVPKDYFAWAGMFLSLAVLVEVLNIYLSAGVISLESIINRSEIYTGWGINNNMACVLLFGMPCAFYLAATYRKGYRFILVGAAIYLAIIFTNSRNGIVFGGVTYVFCAVISLWRHQNRKGNLIALISIVFTLGTVWICSAEFMLNLFAGIFQLGFDDNGRFVTWWEGIKQFAFAPFLGKGFYGCQEFQWGSVDIQGFLPPRWHNTVIQLGASCGVVGLLAYGYHRYQPVRILIKNPSFEKMFIWICIGGILLTSLLDCHLFNIGPGLLYSVFLAFLEKQDLIKTNELPPLLGQVGFKRRGLNF